MRETQALYRQIADSAIGLHAGEPASAHPGSGMGAAGHATPPAIGPMTASDSPAAPRDLLQGARAHLAAADAQLQQRLLGLAL